MPTVRETQFNCSTFALYPRVFGNQGEIEKLVNSCFGEAHVANACQAACNNKLSLPRCVLQRVTIKESQAAVNEKLKLETAVSPGLTPAYILSCLWSWSSQWVKQVVCASELLQNPCSSHAACRPVCHRKKPKPSYMHAHGLRCSLWLSWEQYLTILTLPLAWSGPGPVHILPGRRLSTDVPSRWSLLRGSQHRQALGLCRRISRSHHQ